MISEYSTMILHAYLMVFGGALLAYDYALTFSMEVERFWFSRKFSTTTALYFANRYIGLVGYAPILYQFLGAPGEDECRRLQVYAVFYAYFLFVSVGALMTIRVYALYNCDSVVLWVLGAHSTFGLIMCVILRRTGVLQNEIVPQKALTALRCVPYRLDKEGKASAIAWSVKLLFDLMVVLLTVYKSTKYKQAPRPVLIDMLIADGVLCFATSLVLNILCICFFLWAPPYLRTVGSSLTAVICSIVASRMTLNLRDPDIIPHPTESSSDQTHESEHFVSTILTLAHPSYAESLRSRSAAGSSTVPLRGTGTQRVD